MIDLVIDMNRWQQQGLGLRLVSLEMCSLFALLGP